MTELANASATEGRPPIQRAALGAAIGVLGAVAALLIALNPSTKQAGLLALGALMGLVLYQTTFGFAGAYRRLIVARETAGAQAQLLMLALATLGFAPILAAGTVFGNGVTGAVAPAGLQVAIGAFAFGLGMQLGGGCGSGTLFSVGGGSPRMLVTLAAFVAGSFWASLDMPFWWSLPAPRAIALGDKLGWPQAVGLQLALFALISLALRWWGAGRQSRADAHKPALLRGPWPLVWGAVALAGLNLATLAYAGHPWSITWAFTLWGAEAAQLVGWDPSAHAFWRGGFASRALAGGILADTTSIMDVGIIVGAFAAATLAGRFRPDWRLSTRSLAAAVLGGLLMGYGARIAFGCNIGAFFSGVASTSLHGWLWIAAAFPGTWLGVRLRPVFGLVN